jgi:hypothetical protein
VVIVCKGFILGKLDGLELIGIKEGFTVEGDIEGCEVIGVLDGTAVGT